MLAGLQEQIASGAMPASLIAKLYKKLDNDMGLPDALVELDEEVREEQAAAAAEAQQGMDPNAMMANPQAQMGLAAGPGAAAPGAPQPGMAPPPRAAPSGGGPAAEMQAMLASAMAGA
jgi:hypothetical protein